MSYNPEQRTTKGRLLNRPSIRRWIIESMADGSAMTNTKYHKRWPNAAAPLAQQVYQLRQKGYKIVGLMKKGANVREYRLVGETPDNVWQNPEPKFSNMNPEDRKQQIAEEMILETEHPYLYGEAPVVEGQQGYYTYWFCPGAESDLREFELHHCGQINKLDTGDEPLTEARVVQCTKCKRKFTIKPKNY